MSLVSQQPMNGNQRPVAFGRNLEIFIVDDDAAVREPLALVFILAGYRVRTFADAASFLAAAHTAAPACVLLDVYMPHTSGLEVLQQIGAATYPAPIFMLSGRGDIPTAIEAIQRGAIDFIEKSTDPETIVARVMDAMEARSRRGANDELPALWPLSFAGCKQLTPRERDVLGQIMAGLCNREAAKNLGISQRTVEVHRAHVMLKLDARNAADLVRKVMSGLSQRCA